MGGLGHLAVKLAAALGAEDAKHFGAKEVVINQDGADFSKLKHAFDFALDTFLTSMISIRSSHF